MRMSTGIYAGMVVHQYIFRWYPSGIIDFTGFLKVSLAVIQETYYRLGLACNVWALNSVTR